MIDVHTHVVPAGLPFAGRDGSDWPRVEIDGDQALVTIQGRPFRTVSRAAWDPERRREEMAPVGVRRQVLSPMPELFCYWADPASAEHYCRDMNGWIADQLGDHFDGFGIVPLQDPDRAAAQLQEVKELGLRGVEIGSNVDGELLHEARFEPFFAELERLDLAVFVHPFHPHGFESITGGPAGSAVTFPNEVGFALGGLIAEGALERHPGLRLFASHGGGSLGLLLSRMDRMWAMDPSWSERLPERPSAYARRIFVDLLVFAPDALSYILSIVGDRQVVVGSDYPFMPDPPGQVLDGLPGLEDEARERIRTHNAVRLLQLGTE